MNQLDVCPHLSNLADLHHDKLVYFGVPLLIIPHLGSRPTGRVTGKSEGRRLSKSDSVPTVAAVARRRWDTSVLR